MIEVVNFMGGFYRGWRVYVLDEHGTSSEASDRMIVMLVPLLILSLLLVICVWMI